MFLSLADTVRLRERWRADGRRVAFTNGCFDLLHPGHVSLLEAARATGDALIVAINSDASVREIKGPTRPVIPQHERAEVLLGLDAVDAVVLYDEPTPQRVIDALVPDVLVKGADWAIDEIVGRETVEAAGGQVVRVPLVEGRSTTSILERIRKP
jgi:D-beta-D-heptose 7-phosphate kinase/D-beta-D-heptose 1-phosphate adenosyltransferase